ncbi:acetate uptake transporter [Pseudarthrobacter sp. H3Y2-7]|uniref:acetate uptake transporter n=1 Tax=Pseudarthrobacter naphthalenicus TaxID=3031328 RepID=UPI0023AE6CFF|nr:acetate uptake transporter [Pseudarthrobacter sp. H3Y2-7]MDE8670253.1 acetate uptake transporter [Pseudarthrobacter sp. H3Y2-7]
MSVESSSTAGIVPAATGRRAENPVAAKDMGISPQASVSPPFADPAALGLGAFAMTTFVLSVINAGLIPKDVEPVVLGLALFYGGLAQFAAGIWEFANRNVFGATAFCSYGAFWLSFWFLSQFSAAGLPAADAGKAVGLYLLAWAIFTAYMTVSAWRVSTGVFAVFVFLTLTFIALFLGAFAGATGMTVLGGWLGIVTALIAWYCSLAVVANATYKRTVLPVGRR